MHVQLHMHMHLQLNMLMQLHMYIHKHNAHKAAQANAYTHAYVVRFPSPSNQIKHYLLIYIRFHLDRFIHSSIFGSQEQSGVSVIS